MINHFGQTFGFNFTDVSSQRLQAIFGRTVTDTLCQVPSQTYHHGSAGVYRFESPLKVNKHSICNIVTTSDMIQFNPLSPKLNPICYLLALLAHHFLHVSRIRVKSLTLRLLMSYIYMEHLFLMFLDHTQRRSTVGRTPLDE